ncbi:MAG: response regulator [Chloroflexota bacterium]
METLGAGENAPQGRDWTMTEVAKAKGVAYQTVWRAISRGQLPARRVGRTVLVSSEAAEAWRPCYDRVPRRFRDQPRLPRPRTRDPEPPRALVAEDEPAIRALLVQIIEDEGVSAVAVGDGEAAVAAARRESFTHVFLDVRMPRLDGPTAFPAIRQACPNAVIAFVTAYPDDLAKVAGPDVWPVVVIPKPFDIRQIVGVLRMSVADHRAWRKGDRRRGATLTAP